MTLTDEERETAFRNLDVLAEHYLSWHDHKVNTMRIGDEVIRELGVLPVLQWGREHHITVTHFDDKLLCRRHVIAGNLPQAVNIARERAWGRRDRDWWYVPTIHSLRGISDPVTLEIVGSARGERRHADLLELQHQVEIVNSRWRNFPYA